MQQQAAVPAVPDCSGRALLARAAEIRAAREELAASNARAAAKAEADFERTLIAYIDNSPRVYHGGLVNLLGALQNICENREGKDYETAAAALEACAAACDLEYPRRVK